MATGGAEVRSGRRQPWPIVRLGDVCDITAGNSAPQDKTLFLDGTHPFIRTSDVGELHFGTIVRSRDNLNDTGIIGLRLFPKGSVLFPKSGASTYLNHRALLGVNAYVVSHLAVIMPREQVYPQYLLYALAVVDAKTLMQDSSYPALRTTEIGAAKLPLPPLSAQREIVARLERELAAVEKMKAGFEALAETAQREFKAELKEAFGELKRKGTETRRLGDVCECKKGPFGSALTKSIFVPRSDSTVKVYEQKNAIRKDATLGSYYITRQYFDAKMRSFEVKPADIIISCAGTIGETYILPSGCEQGVINQALMRVRTCSCLDKLFFLFFFETILNVVNDSSNGSAMKNIPPFKIFKAFEIPVPSLAEQREVVARLDAAKTRTEKLEAKAKEGAAVCETLRKAILKEAFAGAES